MSWELSLHVISKEPEHPGELLIEYMYHKYSNLKIELLIDITLACFQSQNS